MTSSIIERITGGRTDLVLDLLAAGEPASVASAEGVPVIRWCARYGDVSAIRVLLDNGESLDTLGANFDLSGAAFHGHWRLCEFLIERGADVNYADPVTGETPLHQALCKANRPAYDLVVQVLLAHGADPNRATRPSVETGVFMRDSRTRGETPLHRAAAFGSAEAIQLLIDAGALKDAKDAHGDSPLSWASWHTRPDAILRKLCYGSHRVGASRDSTYDHGSGWGVMERDLLGTPHTTSGRQGNGGKYENR